jgi:hypothetical protein
MLVLAWIKPRVQRVLHWIRYLEHYCQTMKLPSNLRSPPRRERGKPSRMNVRTASVCSRDPAINVVCDPSAVLVSAKCAW